MRRGVNVAAVSDLSNFGGLGSFLDGRPVRDFVVITGFGGRKIGGRDRLRAAPGISYRSGFWSSGHIASNMLLLIAWAFHSPFSTRQCSWYSHSSHFGSSPDRWRYSV